MACSSQLWVSMTHSSSSDGRGWLGQVGLAAHSYWDHQWVTVGMFRIMRVSFVCWLDDWWLGSLDRVRVRAGHQKGPGKMTGLEFSPQHLSPGPVLLASGEEEGRDSELITKDQWFFFFNFFFISWRLITLQYCSGFCHTLKWISHGFTCLE